MNLVKPVPSYLFLSFLLKGAIGKVVSCPLFTTTRSQSCLVSFFFYLTGQKCGLWQLSNSKSNVMGAREREKWLDQPFLRLSTQFGLNIVAKAIGTHGQDRTGQMDTRTGKPVVVFVIVVVALDVYHTTGDDSKKKKEKRRGECSTCYPPPGLRL